jgi:Tol biopolymer transport system component
MRSIVSLLSLVTALFLSQTFYQPSTTVSAQTPAQGKIAFTVGGNGTTEIFVINADGTGQTKLTDNLWEDQSPSWSPDGSQIVYESGRVNGGINLFRMNADGSNPIQLTNVATDGFVADPVWSPDGTRIAFARDPDRDGKSEIWVMNADGTNPIRLTTSELYPTNTINKVYSQSSQPVWSPDGKKIAFSSYRNGNLNRDIYVMNADGSNQTRLTTDPLDDTKPTWSPDGSKIAFASSRGGGFNIYVMNSDGSNQVHLTGDAGSPAWSPDGTKIAFVRIADGILQLHLMDTDGSNQIKLTNNPIPSFAAAWQTTSGPLPPPPPPPATYSVSGRVVDSSRATLYDNGPGISGITLTLSGANSTITTQTDANGNYYIGGLPESATYTITPTTTSWSYSPANLTFRTDPHGYNIRNRNVTVYFSAAPIHLQFDTAEYKALEGSSARITVIRNGFITGNSTIDYSTSDGTARAGSDYVPTSGTLRFSPGEYSKSFNVPLIIDTLQEGSETINLTLSNPTGATIRVQTTAVITINDPPPPQLLTDESGQAAALNALNLMRDPFPLVTTDSFGTDTSTRVALFARNMDFWPGEDISVVTVEAEDSQHRTHQLTVETIGKAKNFNWLSQVVVKLPEDLAPGDVLLRIYLRGVPSNQALIRIN